jgi:hypothetical protein
MKNKIPSYEEKEFLIYLLDKYLSKYKTGTKDLPNFTLSAVVLPSDDLMRTKFPKLFLVSNNTTKCLAYSWFNETTSRGYTNELHPNMNYSLTLKGYKKALRYKHPVKYFLKDHWKFIITLVVSVFVGSLFKELLK